MLFYFSMGVVLGLACGVVIGVCVGCALVLVAFAGDIAKEDPEPLPAFITDGPFDEPLDGSGNRRGVSRYCDASLN
jgi:hypothetical protein